MIKNDNNQKKSRFFLKPCSDPDVSEGNSLCSADKRTVEQGVSCELNTSQGRLYRISLGLFQFWFGQSVVSNFGLFRHCHGVFSAGFLGT